jgi:hypothetical protein
MEEKQMKISKILAGMSAAALAASMMSLAAFADETAWHLMQDTMC